MSFDYWVDDPPSQEIADILNATAARECAHGHRVCVAYCGVWRALVGAVWQPFTAAERGRWRQS